MENFPEVVHKSLIGRAYQIINAKSGGITTDDSDLSVRHVMRSIVSTYGKVLEDYMTSQQREGLPIPPQLGIEYNCYRLEDAKEECGFNCGIKRVKIPTFASFAGAPALFFFGTDSMSFTYAKSRSEAITFARPKPMNAQRPAYWITGGYANVVLPPEYSEICMVNFNGIPETPVDSEDSCFDIWSEEFPIPEHLWERVKALLIAGETEEIVRTSQLKDQLNNAASGNEVAGNRP